MSDAEKKVRRYLVASCGNGGYPTRHSLRCLLGMVETGEVTWDDLCKVGGDWLVKQVEGEMSECN